MKAFAVTVLLTMAASAASANPILEPYAPFKLVGVMPDTQQALLWDENDAEYRLAKLGDDLGGWRVSSLDAQGLRISLQKEDLIDELELVRLPRPGSVIIFREARDARVARNAASTAAPTPISAVPPAAQKQRPAEAPKVLLVDVPREAEAPTAQAPAPAPAPAPEPEPEPARAPEPAPSPRVFEQLITLGRGDLDREINDFDKLMATVRVAQADDGGFVIIKLDPRSWIASLGFRQGDTVRSVAGETVSTVEDAARVYAQLRTLDAFDAELERGDTKVILKFQVK